MAAQTFTITGTSPASASTAVVGTPITFDRDLDTIDVVATIAGATGGTLDLYLQTSEDNVTYTDAVHFAQLAAGAPTTRARVILNHGQPSGIVTVGQGSTPALAANSAVQGLSAKYMRLVAVAGASTSAGSAQSVAIAARYKVNWHPNY